MLICEGPLYRDAAAQQPNVTDGLLCALTARLGTEVSVEDLAAYAMGILGHGGYTETFSEALEASPARVPMTADPELFARAVAIGERLLWLQSYGERYTSPERPKGRVPRLPGISWSAPVSAIPDRPQDITYDSVRQELTIGDGVVTGVRPEVREFNVSGLNVLDKWLGARTVKGIGRAAGKAATPLDRIRPHRWADEWNDELLDLLRVLTATVEQQDEQVQLLSDILAAELIPAGDLPTPSDAERKVPATIKRDLSAESALD